MAAGLGLGYIFFRYNCALSSKSLFRVICRLNDKNNLQKMLHNIIPRSYQDRHNQQKIAAVEFQFDSFYEHVENMNNQEFTDKHL